MTNREARAPSTASDRVRAGLGPNVAFSLVVPQAFAGAPDDEVPSIIRRARAEHGFGAFEIVPPGNAEAAGEVREALQEGDSRVVYLAGLPLLRAKATLSGPEESRRLAVRTVQSIIRQAADAGAEAVMVTSGPRDTTMTESEQLAGFVDSLVLLAGCARREATGVMIRVEPTDTDVQHRQLVGGTALSVSLVHAVAERGEFADLNLDTSHLLQLGEDSAVSLALARPECSHVHIANCVLEPSLELYGDRHPPFGFPGSLVDVPRVATYFAQLRRLGYLDADNGRGGLVGRSGRVGRNGLVGVEVIPPAGTDAWRVLDQAVTDLASAFELEASTGG